MVEFQLKEISIRTGQEIINNLDKNKYEVFPLDVKEKKTYLNYLN